MYYTADRLHVAMHLLSNTGPLILRAVTEPRIWTKSAKFTKTREFPRNSLEILPNTCRHNIFESYLGCWGCILAVNVLVYLETSSPQRVNNILQLPGVLRLMLRKTGKQQCKIPGVPSEDRRNWGWECDGLCVRSSQGGYTLFPPCSSWRMYALYVHLTYKDDDLFQNGSFHEW